MTTQLTSKFSLYDILSMILPGCLWLWCGKIIFSHCSCPIVKAVNDIIENWSNSHDVVWVVAVFLAAGYIVGLLTEIVIGDFWRRHIANRPCCIAHVYQRMVTQGAYHNIQNAKGNTEQNRYFYAYEYVRQNSKKYTIDIVEGQVAMLRNTRWPASILAGLLIGKAVKCSYCCCCCCCCCGILAGLLVWIVMYAFALLRLQKVYEMVLDSYEFLIDVEKSKK